MQEFDPDFMTEYNLLRDVEESLEEQHSKRKKKMNIVYTIIGIIQVPFLTMTLIDMDYLGLWVIIGLVSFIITLILFLVFKTQLKNRILYDVIYPRAVSLFNQEHDRTFQFEFKPKLEKTFNQDMGLFTKYASVSSTYKMTSQTDQGTDITIQACRLVTSNGKSSTLHFDGVYLILPISGIPYQQLRTDGKPRLKDVSFARLEDYPDDKLYVQEDQIARGVHPFLMQVFEELPDQFELKRHYIASNKSEVHLALWLRKKPTMPKAITSEELDRVVNPLHHVMQYALQLFDRFNDMY